MPSYMLSFDFDCGLLTIIRYFRCVIEYIVKHTVYLTACAFHINVKSSGSVNQCNIQMS